MKKLFSLIGILLLGACGSIIEVDDLGVNWNRGEIDHAFIGQWLDETGKSPEVDLITEQGRMYRIVSLDEKQRHEPDLGKTLRVGNYRFYMVGPRSTYILFGPVKGGLLRYSIINDKMYIYVLSPTAMRDLLDEKYPQERNIVVRHTCTDAAKNNWCYDYIEISKLDKAALTILSEIPNSDTFWEGGVVLTRVRH